MEIPSQRFADASSSTVEQSRLAEDWRLARAAHRDLQLAALPPVNLLVIGADGVVQNILKLLSPALNEPIATWHTGERLPLPPSQRAGTVILDDVGTLELADQHRLLEWLEEGAGRTRLVSTATTPLFPLVETGAFSDTLYYRLNMVCVDATRQRGHDGAGASYASGCD